MTDRQNGRDSALSALAGFLSAVGRHNNKSLNVMGRQAATHLATIFSPLPGQFTKSKFFFFQVVVCEAGEIERGGGGEQTERQ